MVEFVVGNWEYFLLGTYIAEKVVKLTPTKYDDILFDMIVGGLNEVRKMGKKED